MRTLVIAAHPDDEVLGCGAYMSKLASGGHEVLTVFVSDGESSRFPQEEIQTGAVQSLINQRKSQAFSAAGVMGTLEPKFLDFPDNRLDQISRLDITQALENVMREFIPQRVITHHWSDLNIDHQILNEVTQVMARPQNGSSIQELMYFELPSSTEWRASGTAPFMPDVFVDVTDFVSHKMKALDAYGTEMRPFPHPRSPEAIDALLKWRGASSGFDRAEAFSLGRLRIG